MSVSADTRDEALRYLREQFGEGWAHHVVPGGPPCYGDAQPPWVAWVWLKVGAGSCRVDGSGPDPMSAARACVEAWREATEGEREHADRLAEALREALPKCGNCDGKGRMGWPRGLCSWCDGSGLHTLVHTRAGIAALAAHDARRSTEVHRAGGA